MNKDNIQVEVSVVIVCMNNLKNLYPCLDCIREYTKKVNYEVLVVAYLFSEFNLQRVRYDYPWVTLIESNDIRGFAENNNLALRKAKGKYCFVLNDDTEFYEDVIGGLVSTIELLGKEVAIVSPKLVYPDGSLQVCGVPYKDWRHIVLTMLHLYNAKQDKKYSNKEGIFQSYNIIGAAFLIKSDILKKAGYFDEYFFFSPEDVALSTKVNKLGYQCWVNADVILIHKEGMSNKSLSMIQTATRPAHAKGGVYFYSGNHDRGLGYWSLCILYFIRAIFQFIVHRIRSYFKPLPNEDYIMSIGDLNTFKSILTNKTPKEIFIHFYTKLK